MTEYPRFKEWSDKNFPSEQYFSAEDRLADIEMRMNSDGRSMPEQLRQSLLLDFQADYDPRIRDMQERQMDQQQAADMLGSGTIPHGMSEEIIEGMHNEEIMGVDISDIAERPEGFTPQEVIEGKRGGFFNKLTTGFRGFFKRLGF